MNRARLHPHKGPRFQAQGLDHSLARSPLTRQRLPPAGPARLLALPLPQDRAGVTRAARALDQGQPLPKLRLPMTAAIRGARITRCGLIRNPTNQTWVTEAAGGSSSPLRGVEVPRQTSTPHFVNPPPVDFLPRQCHNQGSLGVYPRHSSALKRNGYPPMKRKITGSPDFPCFAP
jgi:hypothetical protein